MLTYFSLKNLPIKSQFKNLEWYYYKNYVVFFKLNFKLRKPKTPIIYVEVFIKSQHGIIEFVFIF